MHAIASHGIGRDSSTWCEQGDADQLRVRRAELAIDRDLVVGVLERNFPGPSFSAHFEWLCRRNPAGEAFVWLVEDRATGRAVGISVCHPRHMRVDGLEVMALNHGYLAVDAEYRSLGPALKLMQASLEPVRGGQFAFSYDHPSESMLAVCRRMGRAVVGRMQRWVRLLALRDPITRRFGRGIVSRVLGMVGDLALRVQDALTHAPGGITVDVLNGDCGEEFDALDRRLRGVHRVEGVRSAAYLNWRYLGNATCRHEVICARRSGELTGYAVVRPYQEDGRAILVDMAPSPDEQVRRALLVHVIARARERGAIAVDTYALADSAANRMFRALGFMRRQTGRYLCSSAVEGSLSKTLGQAGNWWMMVGDRDADLREDNRDTRSFHARS